MEGGGRLPGNRVTDMRRQLVRGWNACRPLNASIHSALIKRVEGNFPRIAEGDFFKSVGQL
jgi:hypothetical protein